MPATLLYRWSMQAAGTDSASLFLRWGYLMSTTEERNPLVTPAVGDVVEKIGARGVLRRKVTEYYPDQKFVVYEMFRDGRSWGGGQCFISTWMEWCSKATVVEKASGDATAAAT